MVLPTLFAILAVVVSLAAVIVVAVATIDDYFHNKRACRRGVEYRLPWIYRLQGWQIGQDMGNTCDAQNHFFIRPDTNEMVPIVRLRDWSS